LIVVILSFDLFSCGEQSSKQLIMDGRFQCHKNKDRQ